MGNSEFMTEFIPKNRTRFKKISPNPEIEHSDGKPSIKRIYLDAEDNPEKVDCEICLEKFDSQQSLKYHKDVEHRGIRYKSQECQKGFQNKLDNNKNTNIIYSDKNLQFEKNVQTEN